MKKLFATLLLVFAALIISCSDDEAGDNANNPTTESFGGPGSAWEVEVSSDNTFEMTKFDDLGGTEVLSVEGTYEEVDSGFLKLTVTSASGTNAPSAGDEAYAMFISEFVMLVKPVDGDDKIIPMVVTGTCPTSTINFNWMVTGHENSGTEDLTDDEDLLGTASWDGTDTLSIGSKFALDKTDLSDGFSMSGTCSNGTISLTEADIWLSQSEAALVKTQNNQIIVALPQQTISSASDLDGEYYGLLFDDNNTEKVQPVFASIDTGGTSSAGSFTDIDTDTKDTADVTLSGFTINDPANGFVEITVTIGASNSNMICQAATDVGANNQKMMFCVGTSVDDNKDLFNVLLLSKD